MPEIAEVRVVKDALMKNIIGRKIKKVKILYPNIVVGDKQEFANLLENRTFKGIKTSGKWLIFNLGEYSLLSHLRMEGKYFYVPSDTEIGKHNHIIFELDNGMDLRYDDVRKFGKMELVKTKDVYENESIKKLGLEPDDDRLTPDYLIEKFKNKKIDAKNALLDQTIINGLGNIYANEVLFACKISPFREVSKITYKEAEAIIENSRKIVKKAYEMGGSTIKSYTSSLGVTGHYQGSLLVHKKEGEPCPICGTPIKRKKIGGRSAYYCDKCQK